MNSVCTLNYEGQILLLSKSKTFIDLQVHQDEQRQTRALMIFLTRQSRIYSVLSNGTKQCSTLTLFNFGARSLKSNIER